MLIHDIIKIKYTEEGYLPNYPYHLITDDEMCDAFLSDNEICFFNDFYPLPDTALEEQYKNLKSAILYHIGLLKNLLKVEKTEYTLPNWIYSYMLGEVISDNSDIKDKHDLFVLLNLDNMEDKFTGQIAKSCYDLSELWLQRFDKITAEYNGKEIDTRPPSMFGEPHLIKYLRLISNDLS